MRLLHVFDIIKDDYSNPIDIKFAFKEFFVGQSMPEYAILSHTWESEEVSYQALADLSFPEHLSSLPATVRSSRMQVVKQKYGYLKIVRFCNQFLREGLQYGWVDTCCIDKTSSAELSEAINSVYQWYESSKVCFAHLADVHGCYSFPEGQSKSRCRWFTRGWTLQELIAPKKLLFFDSEWKFLFDKASESHSLELHTGIEEDILNGALPLTSASVAQRMSWACGRETSRLEDIAYCLLGIFQVNMPLLYGEGKRAFIRLQEAIMQDSSDQSLFTWSDCDPGITDDIIRLGSDRLSGLLASSPSQFAHARNIVPYHHKALTAEYRMTNEGLRIKLPVYEIEQSGLLLGILNCARHEHSGALRYIDSTKRVAIYLRSAGARDQQQYARCHYSDQVASATSQELSKATRLTIYVRKKPVLGYGPRITSRHGLHLASEPHKDSGVLLTAIYPLAAWQKEDNLVSGPITEVVLGFSLSSSAMAAVLIETKPDVERALFETTEIHCTCRLVTGDFSSGIVEDDLKSIIHIGRANTSKSFVDLNDHRRLIATVSKTKLLGEDIFTLDVSVVPNKDMLFELPEKTSVRDRSDVETSSCHSAPTSDTGAESIKRDRSELGKSSYRSISMSNLKSWKRIFTKKKLENHNNAMIPFSSRETQQESQQEEQYDWNGMKPGQIRVIDFYSVLGSKAYERPAFK